MRVTPNQEIARVCEHVECANSQAGTQVGRAILFEDYDMLEHVLSCPILARQSSGMPDDCPNWRKAKIIRR